MAERRKLCSRYLSLLLLVLVTVCVCASVMPHRAQAQTNAPGPGDDQALEEQLARQYAPIVYLKRQSSRCDAAGEPYVPLPVEAVLDNPSVTLRLDTGGRNAAQDRLVVTGPGPRDLAWLGEGYYLDFPGDPLSPGCDYESWSRSLAEEYEPTVYARIATEEGVEGLALQYWLFWVFNDFNNNHEGDWEMIQLTFSASTVEEALTQQPDSVTYAQHGGAERAAWDDDKVHREDDRLVVYPAAGSHASYYNERLFVGWGENGTGFGCDNTTAPVHRVPLRVVLIPRQDQISRTGEFAWLLYQGRWGERLSWEFNGPFGPQLGKKWQEPVSWIDTVRERSLYVPDTLAPGPMPAAVFCTVTERASEALIAFALHPWRVAVILIALFAGMVYLTVSLRGALLRAARVYRLWWEPFSGVGLVLIPLGALVTALQQVITRYPPGEWVIDLIGRSDSSRLIASLLVGSFQTLLEALIIGPAIMAVIEMIRRGEEPDAARAYRVAWVRLPEIARAYVRMHVGFVLRVMSIVGIPFFVRERVRWGFTAQAVLIDGARSARGACSTSAAAVSGSWWRTAAEYMLFSVIGLVPGPLIGIVLMIVFQAAIEGVNALSSVIYAVVVPYKVIGLTLLYLDLTGRPLAVPVSSARRDKGADASESPGGALMPRPEGAS